METKTHHGSTVFSIARQKGFNKTNLANALNISRQGLDYHLKREFWNRDTIQDFAKVLEMDESELASKLSSTEEGSNWKEKYFDLLEESKALWQLVAQHGLQVDLGKLVVSGYATV